MSESLTILETLNTTMLNYYTEFAVARFIKNFENPLFSISIIIITKSGKRYRQPASVTKRGTTLFLSIHIDRCFPLQTSGKLSRH